MLFDHFWDNYVHVFSNTFLVSDEFVKRVDCPTNAKVLNIRIEKAEPRRVLHPSHYRFYPGGVPQYCKW